MILPLYHRQVSRPNRYPPLVLRGPSSPWRGFRRAPVVLGLSPSASPPSWTTSSDISARSPDPNPRPPQGPRTVGAEGPLRPAQRQSPPRPPTSSSSFPP